MRIGEFDERIARLQESRDEFEQLFAVGTTDEQPGACFCHLVETTRTTT